MKRSVSVVKETNPRQMSRFTTIAVKEEDLSDAGLANDTAKRRPMISAGRESSFAFQVNFLNP